MNQNLTRIGIQAESAFGGPVTGPLLPLSGVHTFEFKPEFLTRLTKISCFRIETKETAPLSYASGRFDCYGIPSATFDLFLRSLLVLRSTEVVTEGTRNVYRPRRTGQTEIPSFRLYADMEDGRWIQIEGATFTSFRVTVRAQDSVQISAEWSAKRIVQPETNPGWNIPIESLPILCAHEHEISVDGNPFPQAIEVTYNLAQQRTPKNFDGSGVPSGFTRTGPAKITGSLTEYVHLGTDLAKKARDREEFSLVVDGTTDEGRKIKATFPRVMPQTGGGSPAGKGDVTDVIGFNVLQDAALDENDEVQFEVIF